MEQECAKTAYVREAREGRAIAEEGYRFKLALETRVRAHIAVHGDEDDLAGRFRCGQLRAPRARGVVFGLRVTLPEAEALKDRLTSVGVDDSLLARGRDILARLATDQQETAEVKAGRQELTRKVRAAELAPAPPRPPAPSPARRPPLAPDSPRGYAAGRPRAPGRYAAF